MFSEHQSSCCCRDACYLVVGSMQAVVVLFIEKRREEGNKLVLLPHSTFLPHILPHSAFAKVGMFTRQRAHCIAKHEIRESGRRI